MNGVVEYCEVLFLAETAGSQVWAKSPQTVWYAVSNDSTLKALAFNATALFALSVRAD